MIYKIIGFLLIIVAGAGIGHSKCMELQYHLQGLEQLKCMFYLMRGELKYTRAAFEEIFEKISEKMEGNSRIWLKNLSQQLRKKEAGTFQEIWEASIDDNLKQSYLKEKNLNDLKNVGKNLGHLESIDLYIEQLEYEIQSIRESYATKGKLYKSIGVMGGIFLVILLL